MLPRACFDMSLCTTVEALASFIRIHCSMFNLALTDGSMVITTCEAQVNKCDLASARLAVKAMRQENDRLKKHARGQESKIRALEVTARMT